MGWISPWALILGGIDTEIYNAKQRIKHPFRLHLRKKYVRMYNDEHLFEHFADSTNDIYLRSRYNENMYAGNGLFLTLLLKAYREKGKKVKIITFGSREETANYFKQKLGYTVTSLDTKEESSKQKIFNNMDNFNDVLFLNEGKYSLTEKEKEKKNYLLELLDELSKKPKDPDAIYLVTQLYVFDESVKQKLSEFSTNEHIRLVHFELDFPNLEIKDGDVNVIFPFFETHYTRKEKIFETMKNVFPEIPPKMFEKYYHPYTHFFYEVNGKKGIHFMDVTDIKE